LLCTFRRANYLRGGRQGSKTTQKLAEYGGCWITLMKKRGVFRLPLASAGLWLLAVLSKGFSPTAKQQRSVSCHTIILDKAKSPRDNTMAGQDFP